MSKQNVVIFFFDLPLHLQGVSMFRLMRNTVKPLRLALAGIMMATGFLNSLEAVQVTSQVYKAKSLPEEYRKLCDSGEYQTIIKLEKWPPNSVIDIYEDRLMSAPEIKRLGNLKTGSWAAMQIVSSLGYIPAEPVTLMFKDSKNKLDKKISVVPNPLYVKSPVDYAVVEVALCQLYPVSYNVELKGFKKGEELLIKSTSYDESWEHRHKVDEAKFIYMPGVVDKKGGVARLEIIRPSGEVLSLELPWGLEWLKYMLLYDQDGKMKSIVEEEEYRKQNPEVAKYFDSQR